MKAVPRGQVQTKLVARAKTAPGGFVTPADATERKALEELEAQSMAWRSLALPDMWCVNLVNGR